MVLAGLLILVAVAISGFSISVHAQDSEEDEGFKVLGTVIPTFKDSLKSGDSDEEIQQGVFTGDYVGCKKRRDLLDYDDAREDDDRALMAKFISQRKCVPLSGLAYKPLRVGFGTSAVLLTMQGAETLMWVKSKAVMESPPPGRLSHFNF